MHTQLRGNHKKKTNNQLTTGAPKTLLTSFVVVAVLVGHAQIVSLAQFVLDNTQLSPIITFRSSAKASSSQAFHNTNNSHHCHHVVGLFATRRESSSCFRLYETDSSPGSLDHGAGQCFIFIIITPSPATIPFGPRIHVVQSR